MFTKHFALPTLQTLYNDVERILSKQYLLADDLKKLFSARSIYAETLARYEISLDEFFIHPEGGVYNSTLDKAALLCLFEDMQNLATLELQLQQTKNLPRKTKEFLIKQETLIRRKISYQLNQNFLFNYMIEYPEYYWRTQTEGTLHNKNFFIHMTPDNAFEIYQDHSSTPIQIIRETTDLSRKIFNKEEIAFIKDLLEDFQNMCVELLESKYSIIQKQFLLKAIKQRKPLESAEQILGSISQLKQYYKADAYLYELCQEIEYMIYINIKNYTQAKAIVASLNNDIQHQFDTGVIDLSLGNYDQAEQCFSTLLNDTDLSISLPALFNLVQTKIRKADAAGLQELLRTHGEKITSPSPKAFQILYARIEAYEGCHLTLNNLYTPHEVEHLELIENDSVLLLEYIATSYIPETYYNRERALRNFYLCLFSKNIRTAGDIHKLRAAYIQKGLLNMHQLIQLFLRTEKYTEKLLKQY